MGSQSLHRQRGIYINIWGVLCQKQLSKAGTSNYIPYILWDVITCPCPWLLLLAQQSACYSFRVDVIPRDTHYRQTSNISKQYNCWSLRSTWSIACRCCSNYIFILDLTSSFSGLGRDNYITRWETFKFWDLVPLVIEVYGIYCFMLILSTVFL